MALSVDAQNGQHNKCSRTSAFHSLAAAVVGSVVPEQQANSSFVCHDEWVRLCEPPELGTQ